MELFAKILKIFDRLLNAPPRCTNSHCVKIVRIRSFFWSVFSLNAGKSGPERTPPLDTFHAMSISPKIFYIGNLVIYLIEKTLCKLIRTFLLFYIHFTGAFCNKPVAFYSKTALLYKKNLAHFIMK